MCVTSLWSPEQSSGAGEPCRPLTTSIPEKGMASAKARGKYFGACPRNMEAIVGGRGWARRGDVDREDRCWGQILQSFVNLRLGFTLSKLQEAPSRGRHFTHTAHTGLCPDIG